jgi:hypothetical protein
MAGKQGTVRAKLETDLNIHLKTSLDEKGNFSMKGLPAGTYVFWAEVGDKKSRELEGIEIGKNAVINNFKLIVLEGGWLKIKATGCHEEPYFDLVLECNEASSPQMEYDFRTDRMGKLEESIFLEPGKWLATVYFRESGMLERQVKILPDKVTELTFDGRELSLFEENLALNGRLTRFDGTPLSDVTIDIGPVMVPGLHGKDRRWHRAKTDEDGRFYDEGFKPGRWQVQASLRKPFQPDLEFNFPALKIPNDPVNPFPLDLVLPAGRVKGSFFDSGKENAFGERGPWWHVSLLDATREHKDERDAFVCEQNDSGGSQFGMIGIPAGQYRLKIAIIGYYFYYSEPFVLKEGQERDMGKIRLDPCGVLELEVVDEKNKAVDFYDLYFNGEKCGHAWNSPPGLLWEKLPLGEVRLQIRKEGYFKEKELVIKLEPYERAKAKVVMEPE